MIPAGQLRGYILEEVVARLLARSGYRLLVHDSQDPDALSSGSHGLLVRGRGARHQADALGDLEVPVPFSLPTRLFAEAKHLKDPVGLGTIRNAVGVITDVNEHYATDAVAQMHVPLQRHHYRYSLFSVSGFTSDAQDYALAQQISLIDLQGRPFGHLRDNVTRAADALIAASSAIGLDTVPLKQVRTALRLGLGTLDPDEITPTYAGDEPGAAFERALRVTDFVPSGQESLPIQTLAEIVAAVQEVTDDGLWLGFPDSPFVLVLRPDDPEEFSAFLRNAPAEVEVRLRFTEAFDAGGEWAVVPVDSSLALTARFELPQLLEAWILAGDEDALDRARVAKKRLLSTINVFQDGKLTRLRYAPVAARRPTSVSDAVETTKLIRRELASPELAYPQHERDHEGILEVVDAPYRREWTVHGVEALMRRLQVEGVVQAGTIRAAARQGGFVGRNEVYEIGGYGPERTLRGFTRPVKRVTRELQGSGVVHREVEPALVTVYSGSVLAAGFRVPPSVAEAVQRLERGR